MGGESKDGSVRVNPGIFEEFEFGPDDAMYRSSETLKKAIEALIDSHISDAEQFSGRIIKEALEKYAEEGRWAIFKDGSFGFYALGDYWGDTPLEILLTIQGMKGALKEALEDGVFEECQADALNNLADQYREIAAILDTLASKARTDDP